MTMLPTADHTELMTLNMISQNLTETQLDQYLMIYREKRKDAQTILLLALVGFIGIAGIHRLITNDLVWGIVYLLTGGFCGIGTIIDLIKHKEITQAYNSKMANETLMLFNMFNQQNKNTPPSVN